MPGSLRYTPAFAAAERMSNDFTPQSQPISALINCLQQFAIPFMTSPNTSTEHFADIMDPSVARIPHQKQVPAAQAAEQTALPLAGPRLQQLRLQEGSRKFHFWTSNHLLPSWQRYQQGGWFQQLCHLVAGGSHWFPFDMLLNSYSQGSRWDFLTQVKELDSSLLSLLRKLRFVC